MKIRRCPTCGGSGKKPPRTDTQFDPSVVSGYNAPCPQCKGKGRIDYETGKPWPEAGNAPTDGQAGILIDILTNV